MGNKVKIGVAGLGKMGLSHFALLNAHPDTETLACDTSGFLVGVLDKYVPAKLHRRYETLLEEDGLDAVVIATPSRLHAPMVRTALERGLHVFCEKPFCLDPDESEALARLARDRGLVTQVGYHYRHVGAFRRMKQVVDSGALGRITHVLAEAYGPVVLRPKRQSWRTQKSEGGGCLYDYAAHPLNLLNWMFGAPERVSGSALVKVFSADIDDEVLATLQFAGGVHAQLSVNWSDESQRKMTTRMTLIGTNGRLFADRQECQIYLRQPSEALADARKGWTVNYTTDLTEDPWFYLRGEEYSAQIDSFVAAVRDRNGQAVENDFASAAVTDRSIAMILQDAATPPPPAVVANDNDNAAAPRKRGWFGR